MKTSRLLSIFLLLFCFASFGLRAQPNDFYLAQQYYQNQEYEKAVDLLERIQRREPESMLYYTYYFNTLIALKEYDKAEKLAHTRAKRDAGNKPRYQLDEAYALDLNNEKKDAQKLYKDVIDQLDNAEHLISEMGSLLRDRKQYELAIEVYKEGQKQAQNPFAFAYELAEMYEYTKQDEQMFSTYLDILQEDPNLAYDVQNRVQGRLTDENRDLFRTLLLQRVQRKPDNIALSEMLVWYLVQLNDYAGAFVQAKSLDKRSEEGGTGQRVFRLAQSATDNAYYTEAAQMYNYLTAQGMTHPLYIPANINYLEVKKKALLQKPQSTVTDFVELEKTFKQFLKEVGYTNNSVNLQRSLADLQALNIHQLDSAIATLEHTLSVPTLDMRTKAQVKLDLGDYYLMNGDLWEPTLLYGQVEKTFADNPIAHEAKFRNARLSFYRGEFQWAQAQCNVLKASTSQKISNDAIALSLLIQDNLTPEDTITRPLELFAQAELMAFRNLNTKARTYLDSLSKEFPQHSLTDDSWFLLGKMSEKERAFDQALAWYEKVISLNKEDILADDALFRMAAIYDEKLLNKDKAKELYQKLLTDYSNSLYAVEARKRFRTLRGDVDQSQDQQKQYFDQNKL